MNRKARIIKNASYSPVAHLEIGLTVNVVDIINEEKILVRYGGYNYIIDKDCIEYIEDRKHLLKVRNGIDYTRYGFVRLQNGDWQTNNERINNNLDFSLYIDSSDNTLCFYVSNMDVSHSEIEKEYIGNELYYKIDDVLNFVLFEETIDNIGIIFDMIRDDVLRKEIE